MVYVNGSQTVTPTGGNAVDLLGGVVLYYIIHYCDYILYRLCIVQPMYNYYYLYYTV